MGSPPLRHEVTDGWGAAEGRLSTVGPRGEGELGSRLVTGAQIPSARGWSDGLRRGVRLPPSRSSWPGEVSPGSGRPPSLLEMIE